MENIGPSCILALLNMALASMSAVNNELNKLTKPLLIDIIISGKVCSEVPKNVNYKIIQAFLSGKSQSKDKTIDDNLPSQEKHTTNFENSKCNNMVETNTETAQMLLHIDYLKKLNYHLEKRVDEQEYLISLLKDNKTPSNDEIKQLPTSTNKLTNKNSIQHSNRQISDPSENNSKVKQVIVGTHTQAGAGASTISPSQRNKHEYSDSSSQAKNVAKNINKQHDFKTKTVHKQKVTGSNTSGTDKIKTVPQQTY